MSQRMTLLWSAAACLSAAVWALPGCSKSESGSAPPALGGAPNGGESASAGESASLGDAGDPAIDDEFGGPNAPRKPVDVGTPEGDYTPDPGVKTDYADDVDPAHPQPDYPRPRLTRRSWATLNGLWDYAISGDGSEQPDFEGKKLLVPFPLESQLSGSVGARLAADDFLWYQRSFELPRDWRSQRVLLHFGAVDWDASVRVNGTEVATHQGGYDGFSVDITDQLSEEAEQRIVVRVRDPNDSGEQPHGKQALAPLAGSSLLAVSGIWQTVWLEPVPELRIEDVAFETEPETGLVRVLPTLSADAGDATLRAVIRDRGVEVARAEGSSGAALELQIPAPTAWTPASPHLYGVTLELTRGSRVLDSADSYLGLRSVTLGDEGGATKVLLNGAGYGAMGVIYQGYWPEGLYTPPTDAALEADLKLVKELGFSMVRVYEKLETERFYYWADRLGLLVWQDVPSGNNATASGRATFAAELAAMVSARRSHPSLAVWALFGSAAGREGADVPKLVERVKQLTAAQLVIGASGAGDDGSGDLRDRPASKFVSCPDPDERAVALGQFGSFRRALQNHSADGVEKLATAEDSARYVDLARRARGLMIRPGLSFAIYQQLTDVENELDGLVSYDRQVLKVDAPTVANGNAEVTPMVPLVQASELDGDPAYVKDARIFRYTEAAPPPDWTSPDFDDSDWNEGPAGIGDTVDVDARIRTPVTFTDLWARTQFELDRLPSSRTFVRMMHDEDTQVYLNGVLITDTYAFIQTYGDFLATDAVNDALVVGTNTLAVHTVNTNLSRYIDVGLWTTEDALEYLPADGAGTKAAGLAYQDFDIALDVLPEDFEAYTPRATGVATQVGTYAPALVADETRALRLHGYVDAPKDGVYTFVVDTDDGARLKIGKDRVAEASQLDGTNITLRAGNIALAAGRHELTLEYFANDNRGENTLSVSWAGPGFALQPIPSKNLSH